MGGLLSFVYGMTLALANLSIRDWQFWVLMILFFVGRFLGYYEGSR